MIAARGEGLERYLELCDRELGHDTVGCCHLDAGPDGDAAGIECCEHDPEHPDAWRDDPDRLGNPALVASCPQAVQRDLRYPSRTLDIPVPHFNSAFLSPARGRPRGRSGPVRRFPVQQTGDRAVGDPPPPREEHGSAGCPQPVSERPRPPRGRNCRRSPRSDPRARPPLHGARVEAGDALGRAGYDDTEHA